MLTFGWVCIHARAFAWQRVVSCPFWQPSCARDNRSNMAQREVREKPPTLGRDPLQPPAP